MKKVAFVAGVVVAAAGVYGANLYLVNKAAQEVPVLTQKAISSVDKNVAEIKMLDSLIHGKNIHQEFAVYFGGDSRHNGKPLYVIHNAEIGFFGLSVKGGLTLPKDKGIAKTFTEEIPFNEKVNYTYKLASQKIDLVSTFRIDPFDNNTQGKIESGTIHFSFKGNEKENSGEMSIDSLKLTDKGKNFLDIDNMGISFDHNKKSRSGKFSLDKMRFSVDDHYRETNCKIKDMKVKSDWKLGSDSTLVNDWRIGSFSLKTGNLDLPSAKIGFSSKIKGLDIDKIEALGKASTLQDEEKFTQLMKKLYEKGLKIKDINLYMDDSNVTGFIGLNPSDYSNLHSSYEFGRKVGENITSELNIKLTKSLIKKLGIPSEFVKSVLTDVYSFKDEKEKYTAKIKIADGVTKINDKIMH